MSNTERHKLISIKITGEDAAKFLQGQLSCDIEHLQSNGSYGVHCNPKGRILSFFYIIPESGGYTLITPKEMLEISEAALKKYAPFYKVSIDNEPTPKSTATKLNPFDLSKKIPRLYPQTSGMFLPHELELQSFAIDFNKGCFTGQEIIARMEYRGKPKSKLFKAWLSQNNSSKPGDDIYVNHNGEARAVAKLVDIDESMTPQGVIALILTTPEYAKKDTLYTLPDQQYIQFEEA